MLKRTIPPKLVRTIQPRFVRVEKRFKRIEKPKVVLPICHLKKGDRFTTVHTKATGALLYANICRARVLFDSSITEFADGTEIINPRYLDICPNTLVTKG
jgi:hypothetical protein